MAISLQPFFSTIALILLDTLHLLKLIFLDPIVYIYRLVLISTDGELAQYYTDKTVLITGASSGLGEAIALHLAKLKCNLILSARSVTQLEVIAAQCKSLSPLSKVYVLAVDLEKLAHDPNHSRQYIDSLTKWLNSEGLKGIDILINNAGVSSRGSALDTDASTLKKVMDINFFGPVQLTCAVMPLLTTGSAIGVISSVQGRLGIPLRTSYAATKHALQGYFDCLRAEIHNKTTVTVISPGYIATNLSTNAISADGSLYGKTDETTAKGMTPQLAAQRSLTAIARGVSDFILADAKVCAAVQAKGQFPQLLASFVRAKSTSGSNKGK